MSRIENAFHKLGEAEHFGSIQMDGFKASVPAERHWLGEGVYFFLDPKGYYWARRWPCDPYKHRTDSFEGIVKTTLETEWALDFRSDSIRNKAKSVVTLLKMRLKFGGLPHTDGAAFAYIFREKLFLKVVEYSPTAIIANFDNFYEQYRIEGSRVFLATDEMEITSTAQIQACVIDPTIIGAVELCLV